MKKGYEKYDYGIYRGQHQDYDIRDKDRNLSTHTRLMLNKSLNMFEYHNLPDSIPERELERILQTSGYCGWVEVEGEIYAVWGGLGGEQDEYYRPTLMTVANPGLKRENGNSYSETLEIGKDVVLMRNDDNMVGLVPIYAKYGTLMSETDLTIYINLINKRAETIISASDDNTAESARQYLKKLEEGEIGYIQESKLYDSLKTNPTHSGTQGSSFTELIELQQYLKGSMYNEIGLNANFNMKRERLNTSEVEMNSEALYPLVDNMLYNRRLALEEVNAKFGTNIQVEFNSSWDYRLGNSEDTGETPIEFEDLKDDKETLAVDNHPLEGSDSDLEGVKDETLLDTLEEELNAIEGILDVVEGEEEPLKEVNEIEEVEEEESEQESDTPETALNAVTDDLDDSSTVDPKEEEKPLESSSEQSEDELEQDSPSETLDNDDNQDEPVAEEQKENHSQETLTSENGFSQSIEIDIIQDNDTPNDDLAQGTESIEEVITEDLEEEESEDNTNEKLLEGINEVEKEIDNIDEEVKDIQKPMNIVRIIQKLNPFSKDK